MSTYVIGDIHGCYKELQEILTLIEFDPKEDILWSAGDLINRGPQSLEVLRFFKNLGDRAIVVLGNHEFSLLAIAQGNMAFSRPNDTFAPILSAPDLPEIIDWLRHLPLLHHDKNFNSTLVHAGLPPQWDFEQARYHAYEVETMLRSKQYKKFLKNLYGNKPDRWSAALKGWKRLRFIVSCFTRIRYCNRSGKLLFNIRDFNDTGFNVTGVALPHIKTHDDGKPWFLVPRASRDMNIIFGHWARLGCYKGQGIRALDSGCVWGGMLTVVRLEDNETFNSPCAGECQPDED
jgi:bis(5'-nucleosyl)-tetraphosphatase (symmetrical)